jgi:hypothetical protein
MTPIFDLLATVTQRLTTIGSGTGVGGSAGEGGEGSWLLPLLRRLLSQPANRRGCYPALLGLLPRVGATAVLEQRPRFIQDLFGAFSSMENVGSACAQLLLALLGRLRDELAGDDATTSGTGATDAAEAAEQGKKKGKGKGKGKGRGRGKGEGKVKVGCKALSAVALASWRSKWVPVLAQGLVSSDKRRRVRLTSFILTDLLKMDPTCVDELLISLWDEAGSPSASPSASVSSFSSSSSASVCPPVDIQYYQSCEAELTQRDRCLLATMQVREDTCIILECQRREVPLKQ